MEKVLTPYEITSLIHIVISTMAIDACLIADDTIKIFVDLNLVSFDDSSRGYDATALGTAHVNQICELSLPKQVFVNTMGEVIGEFNAQT